MPDNTMRTVHFYGYGGPEQLVMEYVPRPEPQVGEVLVRVYAAGVNPIDWKIRKGFFKDVRPVPLPFTPGSELAGTSKRSVRATRLRGRSGRLWTGSKGSLRRLRCSPRRLTRTQASQHQL